MKTMKYTPLLHSCTPSSDIRCSTVITQGTLLSITKNPALFAKKINPDDYVTQGVKDLHASMQRA